MKRTLTVFLLSIIGSSWAMMNSTKPPTNPNQKSGMENADEDLVFRLVSQEEYTTIKTKINYCHIGQTQDVNLGIDLKKVDKGYDFSKLKFIHNTNEEVHAYRLYTGEYLIVVSKNFSQTK